MRIIKLIIAINNNKAHGTETKHFSSSPPYLQCYWIQLSKQLLNIFSAQLFLGETERYKDKYVWERNNRSHHNNRAKLKRVFWEVIHFPFPEAHWIGDWICHHGEPFAVWGRGPRNGLQYTGSSQKCKSNPSGKNSVLTGNKIIRSQTWLSCTMKKGTV